MRQGKDIINRYNTYLRLEKSLSANSIDAYLTDLDKLLRFAEDEKKDVKEIATTTCNSSSPNYVTSASIPDRKHASSRVSNRSIVSYCLTII